MESRNFANRNGNRPTKLSSKFFHKHIISSQFRNIGTSKQDWIELIKNDRKKSLYSTNHWTIIFESSEKFLQSIELSEYRPGGPFLTKLAYDVATVRKSLDPRQEGLEVLIGPPKRLILGVRNRCINHLEGQLDFNPPGIHAETKYFENYEEKIFVSLRELEGE